MICFVITRSKVRTHRRVRDIPGAPAYRIWTYDAVFRARRLPAATWVFTDLDRLSFWELELAAHVYRELLAHGVRVLNDPAKLCQRYALLRRLYVAGFNRFNVWRVDDASSLNRWPVFLRTESGHRGVLTDLIEDVEQLGREIERILAAGYPSRDLMIVEYCAEPVRDGLFRKLAMFRVGEQMVPTLAVHDTDWIAKAGKHAVADAEHYEEELAGMSDNIYSDALKQAFTIGETDYGRADFSLVGGKPQIYEINTNPSIGRVKEHPYATRIQASQLWEQNFVAALRAIDSPAGPTVKLQDEHLRKQRWRDIFLLRSRWVR